jgi:uncharacterized membrane protein YraQ (UPF0718 family)
MSSKERPVFSSQIPNHLLDDISPKERWIMEEISKQGQCQSYLLEEQFKQNDKLESIETQTKLTNGTVKKHIAKFEVIDEIMVDLKQVVDVKRHAIKMASSKITYVVGGLIVLGIMAVVKSPALQEWIKTVLL